MPMFNLTEVIVNDDERIRKELESTDASINELADSLKNVGQINPIIIRRDGVLVAGRRRVEAARRLGWETIRVDFWEELDRLTQKIVEFDENDKRKQLTWQEKAAAIADIHILSAQRAPVGTTWRIEDTAEAIGQSKATISQYLVLATAMANPRVAKRPSYRGALDTAKRERELLLVRELARRRAKGLGIVHEASANVLTGGVVYNSDCRVVLETIERETVDLVIMDPPWGIDFDKASQWSKRWIKSYDDSPNAVRAMLQTVFRQLYHILKPTCHLYTFFPIQDAEWWVTTLTATGFVVRQRPLVWFKTGQPSITDVYTSFLPCYETILWAYKPGENDARRLFSHPIPEGFGFPRENGEFHENQKPVEMLSRMVESSSEPNEIVLDPFAGGGSTLAAAFGLGRYYIGIEQDDVNVQKCVARLREIEAPGAAEEEEEVDDDVETIE
jgi:site-specific DNA-methyltransferase (adenine-specific)